jgi:hypothetical protein
MYATSVASVQVELLICQALSARVHEICINNGVTSRFRVAHTLHARRSVHTELLHSIR